MPIYSNSKLSTYENCPQQYKLRYIDKVELPEGAEEGIEAFLGSRVHDVLEKLYKELILTKLNSLDDLLGCYKNEWDKNWHENVVVIKKGFTKDHYRNAGKEAITNYYKRHQPFNQSKTLATEQLITFKIDNYTIRGFIDRLSQPERGMYEIHDYKTSGSLPSQDKFDNDRQLALYHIGIKEKYPDVKDVQLIWHYLIFDKEFLSTRTDAQLKDLQKEIVSLIKTIEKDTKFEPKESNLCDWCDFHGYCPAKKHEYKVQELPPNKYLKEKGVALVNKYATLKANIKALREHELAIQEQLDLIEDAAITYAKKEGVSRITGSDFALKITEEEVLNFPKSGEEGREELEKHVKKAGIWEEVSGLNLSRLAKILEEDNLDSRIRKQLLKFAEEVEETNVRLVKKKKVEE
ncbi:MAG: PD-(D/E)XK nuclease family protein [Nitrospirae bacterium]|nr:PD-(D/E)XK nuclease family protein [Nitrospirota bacterium]MBI3377432.1 PD-(D/E)XK nuclease family protein [Nitrospirota bacterium]